MDLKQQKFTYSRVCRCYYTCRCVYAIKEEEEKEEEEEEEEERRRRRSYQVSFLFRGTFFSMDQLRS